MGRPRRGRRMLVARSPLIPASLNNPQPLDKYFLSLLSCLVHNHHPNQHLDRNQVNFLHHLQLLFSAPLYTF